MFHYYCLQNLLLLNIFLNLKIIVVKLLSWIISLTVALLFASFNIDKLVSHSAIRLFNLASYMDNQLIN